MSKQLLQPALLSIVTGSAEAANGIQTAGAPPAEGHNQLYVSNREPLRPSPFANLPIGSIKPQGWLRDEWVLEADGMTRHLEEMSHWYSFKNSGWADPTGWDWLKGYGDLRHVLKYQITLIPWAPPVRGSARFP